MDIKKLNKKDLQEIMNLYIKERPNFYWSCSFEEFCRDWVRKCECCGEFVVLDGDEDDLHSYKNFKGEEYKICKECLEDVKDEILEYFEDGEDPNYYDQYVEFHRMEKMR